MSQHRLRIQELETRIVLSHAPTDHIHAALRIELQGEPVEIPANIGLSESGHFNPHTHDDVGELHIGEGGPAGLGSQIRYVTLGDFFDVWREHGGFAGSNPDSVLNSSRIFNYALDSQSDLLMLVNGIANDEFEDYIPHDGDEIEIQFNRTSWHNSIEATDVDGAQGTTVADAQTVIDELDSRRFSDPTTGRLLTVPKKFLDVDDNGILSPLDALLVVNLLSRRSPAAALSYQPTYSSDYADSMDEPELSQRYVSSKELDIVDATLLEMSRTGYSTRDFV